MTNPSQSSHKHALLQLNLAVFLFGFTGLFGKWLSLAPLVIVFGRVSFAFVGVLGLMLASGQSIKLKNRRDCGPLILSSVLLAGHWIAFFASIQVSSVAICLISFSTAPMLIALLEPLFFANEPLKWSSVLVALTVTVGVAIATPAWRIDNTTTQGILWGLASGLFLAFLTLLNRRQIRYYSPLVITLYQMGFVALLLLPLILWQHPRVTAHEFALLALLGVVFTGAAQLIFLLSLRAVTARVASIVSSGMEVIYGVVLAALILNEWPGARTVLGGAVILGATLYAMQQHRVDAVLDAPLLETSE